LLVGKLIDGPLLYIDRSSTNSRAAVRSKCANAPLPSPSKRFERRTAALAMFRGEHHRQAQVSHSRKRRSSAKFHRFPKGGRKTPAVRGVGRAQYSNATHFPASLMEDSDIDGLEDLGNTIV
jgi:hypothetical protein